MSRAPNPRQIVLDTETTGLDPADGHRIIEIGAVELVDGQRTGCLFHSYLDPGRPSDPGALAVHGISDASLVGQPTFGQVATPLIRWISGAELIIHNAPFDLGFLDYELAHSGRGRRIADLNRVIDTLDLARERWPTERHSLDAMCALLGIDTGHRQNHGALLDAELLASCYQQMVPW